MNIVTGVLITLPFFLYLLVQALRRQPNHGWLGRLLGIIAVLGPTAAILTVTQSGTTSPEPDSLLLAVGAVGIGLGGILFLLQRKQPGYTLSQSHGLLSAGVGLLLLATPFITPLVMGVMSGSSLPDDAFAQTALAAAPEEETLPSDAIAEGPIPSPTPSPTPQATALPSLTPTFTPYPSATPMPTLPVLLLPTSTSGVMPEMGTPSAAGSPVTAVAGSASCQVTTGANLNLRQSPGTDAAILTTIPNGTNLSASATTADRQWWQVSYNGQVGWVIRDYLYFSAEC